jgi:hypothetical protein
MCQAYEGERDYISSRDAWIRSKGYEAHKAGVSKTDNPEPGHDNPEYSDKVQWDLGWETAAKGQKLW